MENVATISHRLLSRNARTRCGIPPMVSKDPEVPPEQYRLFPFILDHRITCCCCFAKMTRCQKVF